MIAGIRVRQMMGMNLKRVMGEFSHFKRGVKSGSIKYAFSTDQIIGELREVSQGYRHLQQKNIPAAEEMLTRALTILPFYIQNNESYNEQFDSLLSKISKVHAWRGRTDKIVELAQRNLQQSAAKRVILGKQMGRVNVVLSTVGRLDYQLNKVERIIQDNYQSAKQQLAGESIKVEDLLTAVRQGENSEGLEVWHKVRIEESWLMILMNLLTKGNLPRNPAYNKLCSYLLKSAEQTSKTNIIKPLTLMISNLLRTEQYLQAEGMLSYCLDQKREHLNKQLLLNNQEYTLLNLLLAKSYRGVKRDDEAQKLEQLYRPIFSPETLMVQGLLLDSI